MLKRLELVDGTHGEGVVVRAGYPAGAAALTLRGRFAGAVIRGRVTSIGKSVVVKTTVQR